MTHCVRHHEAAAIGITLLRRDGGARTLVRRTEHVVGGPGKVVPEVAQTLLLPSRDTESPARPADTARAHRPETNRPGAAGIAAAEPLILVQDIEDLPDTSEVTAERRSGASSPAGPAGERARPHLQRAFAPGPLPTSVARARSPGRLGRRIDPVSPTVRIGAHGPVETEPGPRPRLRAPDAEGGTGRRPCRF